jgi:hypothetical protein
MHELFPNLVPLLDTFGRVERDQTPTPATVEKTDKTPYYLTEEFCREHGYKSPKQLKAAFGESGWPTRRSRMMVAFPELVPRLDTQGRPIGVVAPEANPDEPTRYNSTLKFNADGSRESDKLVWMTDQQGKDEAFLLEAHGFDPEEWQILSAVQNVWQQASKSEDGITVTDLYQSKITVKPSRPWFDIKQVAAALSDVEAVEVERPAEPGERMLVTGCVDTHFGNSSFEWYMACLARIVRVIESRTWKRIVIPIGSDHFHVDNFKNTTSNGTPQSSVDWPSAWSDAERFDRTILEAALKHSEEVYADYIIGNHDESMSWAYCMRLAGLYPQVKWDVGIDERKVHRWEKVAVGLTHGDGRTRKDLDRIFMSEFPEFAGATVREVHAAHYHHEISVDQFGVVTRSLSTAARTDKWHREEGYVGAMKRFQLFEFEPDSLAAIHYV